MEYYSAIKRNEMELFVVRWMDVEYVLQSEISQKEKNKYRMLPIINSFSLPYFLLSTGRQSHSGSDHDLYHCLSLPLFFCSLPSSRTQPYLFPRNPMTALLNVPPPFKLHLCKPS